MGWLVWLVLQPTGQAAPTFTMGELLGRPTDSSITVHAVADRNLDVYFEYGPDSSSYSGKTQVASFSAGTPIEVAIQGLQPDTLYYYRMRYRETGSTEFLSRDEHSFHTQRKRGSTFSFAVQADPHLDENSDPEAYRLTLKNMLAGKSDFLIDLGDTWMTDKIQPPIAYQAVVDRVFQLRSYYDIACHSLPLFFVLGNHEAEWGNRVNNSADSLPVWDTLIRKLYIPNPFPDAFYTGGTKEEKFVGLRESYYAWEWGHALFVVLDPYWHTPQAPEQSGDWSLTLGREQYDWLKRTLEGSSARFKFVFSHNLVGGWNKGGQMRGGVEAAKYLEWGGYNLDDTPGFSQARPGWPMPIHNLLVANRVHVFFHGHDHFYGKQDLDGIVYQESPQPSAVNTDLGTRAASYGYTTGRLLGGIGYLRCTVSPDDVNVEYVQTWVPAKETQGRKNGSIGDSYILLPFQSSTSLPTTTAIQTTTTQATTTTTQRPSTTTTGMTTTTTTLLIGQRRFIPKVLTETGQSTGIAVMNPLSSATSLIFKAYSDKGLLLGTAQRSLDPRGQVAFLFRQLFPDLTQAAAWCAMESSSTGPGSMFLFFDDGLTWMDGAAAPQKTLLHFVLPAPENGEIVMINPSATPNSFRLDMVGENGAVQGTREGVISASGRTLTSISSLRSPSGSGGYVRGQSSAGVAALVTFGDTRWLAALPGVDTDADSPKLQYAPQVALGGGFTTRLDLINLENAPQSLTLKLISENGTVLGSTASVLLSPSGSRRLSVMDLLGSTPGTSLVQGYLRVESDLGRFTGSVTFNDSESRQFGSAMVLSAAGSTTSYFPHLAQNKDFFTGLAAVNPNLQPVTITVEVFHSNGALAAAGSQIVPAGGRFSRLLPQLVGTLPSMDKGYVRATSASPVICFALFGTHAGDVLAAIPADN